jgi:hypothetical protein
VHVHTRTHLDLIYRTFSLPPNTTYKSEPAAAGRPCRPTGSSGSTQGLVAMHRGVGGGETQPHRLLLQRMELAAVSPGADGQGQAADEAAGERDCGPFTSCWAPTPPYRHRLRPRGPPAPATRWTYGFELHLINKYSLESTCTNLPSPLLVLFACTRLVHAWRWRLCRQRNASSLKNEAPLHPSYDN